MRAAVLQDPLNGIMLRTVRSTTWVRRLLAVIVAFAFSGSVVEAAVPDVHDGHAASSNATAGSAFVVQQQWPCASASQPPAGARADATGRSNCGGGQRDHGRSPVPGHGSHLEHCGHGHNAQNAAPPQLDLQNDSHTDAPLASVVTLVSIARAPSLRPPIA